MLNEELKNLFVDNDLSTNMMQEECGYNPDYIFQPRSYNKETGKYEPIGDPIPRPIDVGYAKDLLRMGVDSWKVVGSYGGEDQGSDYYTVWEFIRGDEVAYFKFQGWYQSYHGAEFESVFEVEPQTKTIMVYE